jgi:gamma-butyrobetaine dioxygenase/trimethyllysine dioxygenase
VDIPNADVAKLTWSTPFDAAAIYKKVQTDGAVVVRNWGTDTEALIAQFEAQKLKVRETHFGRIEDLRTDNTTNKNTDQLGYTNAGVDLHTDQTYLEDPPAYQLLQSIRTAESGGESLLSNGRALVDYVKATSRQDYDLLINTPVVFHRAQKNFDKKLETPLIVEEPDGRVKIRLSYFTLAPFGYSFDRTRDWYRAYRRLTSLARSPYFLYTFLLQPGDFILYDNLRTLHGRKAFSGPRWVRGVYFDPV